MSIEEREDKILECRDCGDDFIFSLREQDFYIQQGFEHEPARCLSCRNVRKQRNSQGGAQQGGANRYNQPQRGTNYGGGGYNSNPGGNRPNTGQSQPRPRGQFSYTGAPRNNTYPGGGGNGNYSQPRGTGGYTSGGGGNYNGNGAGNYNGNGNGNGYDNGNYNDPGPNGNSYGYQQDYNSRPRPTNNQYNNRGGDYGNRGGGGRPPAPMNRYSNQMSVRPEERMRYPIICAECGIETEVPFVPRDGVPVFCRTCYNRQKYDQL